MSGFEFDTYDAFRKPIVVLRVNGTSSADLSARVIDMKYSDNHAIGGKKKGTRVDRMELHVSDPRHEFTGDDRFAMHARWDVRWGYPNDMSDIRWFLLSYYEPVYDHQGLHSKKVSLYGSGILLTTVRGAKNWGRIRSSEIARQIAARHSLRFQVEETHDQTETAYIQAAGVSDFEFMNDLAADVDFEFFVENDLLVYRSRDSAYSSSPRGKLIYGAPGSILMSFKPVIKATKDNVVATKGVDTTSGKAINPKVDSNNVGGVHLGADTIKTLNDSARALSAMKPGATGAKIHSGDELTKKIDQLKRDSDLAATQAKLSRTAIDLETRTITTVSVPDTTSAVVRSPETNQQKAKQIATAVKRDLLSDTVFAHMEAIGTPKIRAKANFNIVLPDPALTGPWYAVETSHAISDKGYVVTAKLHRGALTATTPTKVNNRSTAANGKTETADPPKPVVKINLEGGVVDTGTPQVGSR